VNPIVPDTAMEGIMISGCGTEQNSTCGARPQPRTCVFTIGPAHAGLKPAGECPPAGPGRGPSWETDASRPSPDRYISSHSTCWGAGFRSRSVPPQSRPRLAGQAAWPGHGCPALGTFRSCSVRYSWTPRAPCRITSSGFLSLAGGACQPRQTWHDICLVVNRTDKEAETYGPAGNCSASGESSDV